MKQYQTQQNNSNKESNLIDDVASKKTLDTLEYSENGLTNSQVNQLQKLYGKNELLIEKKQTFLQCIIQSVFEPIFLLLIATSIIYFLVGDEREGIIMICFIILIICMDVIQEWKTDKTLHALKKLSKPKVAVKREGIITTIPSSEIVPGDLIYLEEGCLVPADGYILTSHDFCLDESLLTGESIGVWKSAIDYKQKNIVEVEMSTLHTQIPEENYCYAGTLVTQGNATLYVRKIGSQTVYGQIGTRVATTTMKQSPIQKQMNDLTKSCTIIAMFLFIFVSVLTFFNLSDYTMSNRIIESLLSGIVLSLSMIPAEFPVILTVFLSMGAMRLTKKHGLVRRLSSVETLGAVSVICVDKTGTITKNQMTVMDSWNYGCDSLFLARIAVLASDKEPHDPMEKAILDYGCNLDLDLNEVFNGTFLKGYPFSQDSRTMTHVWSKDGAITVAAKGSSEWILTKCNLTEQEVISIKFEINRLSRKGLRVIAVATMEIDNQESIPAELDDCEFTFCGIIGLEDPPKDNIDDNIKSCIQAGIRVVMITGDNGNTAAAIAEQIHLPGHENVITGSEIEHMSAVEIKGYVKNVNVFARVKPEQKLRIIKALQENGEIVAMTGDGVNDAPALKQADIGVAMGLRGSEVAREAADLILLDDNFATIIDSIQDGRRIFDNIRKAIGYVFTIHIPIALICMISPLLRILPSNLMLLPLHVILLELIMNPTCSIALERQPAEPDIMRRGPRNCKSTLLNSNSIIKSFAQGIGVFIGAFVTYYYFLLQNTNNSSLARTMGLSILILSNILLIIVNSSDKKSAFASFIRLKKDNVMVYGWISTIILLLLVIYSPISEVLLLKPLSLKYILITTFISFLFIIWFEIVKLKRK
jgi:Ca2+-transporting ATPase